MSTIRGTQSPNTLHFSEREKEISKQVAPASDDASSWEKIAKMIESGSKGAKSTKDNSRMKSLILECKDGGLKPESNA